MLRLLEKTLQFYFHVLVKNLELELDLAADGKGSSEANSGQLYISLNGIENVNMTNYPRQTANNSNASAAATAAVSSLPGASQRSANR